MLHTYGQVAPYANAVLDINAYISGQIRQVFVRAGDVVHKGQAVVSIFNPEFITTQKGYLQFLKNEEKLQVLREEGRLSDYMKDARENLRWWGMTETQIKALVDQGKVVEEILLPAPADGIITDVFTQPGTLINAGDKTMKAFVVMGRSVARMVATQGPYLIEGFLYFDQQSAVHPGTEVGIQLPSGKILQRAISQMVPAIDSRTQRARFLVPLGQVPELSMGQAVDLALYLPAHYGVWVPRNAVLGQMFSPVVYIKRSTKQFLRQPVSVLSETADALLVAGVPPNATVVVEGKMILEGLYRMAASPVVHGGEHHHDD
ncbi:MAG: efflux RND transporter periplasmic adaptor subunit [Betaproteobacteria bacterium]|nr:efflux RND transporter periplasmic adaptor subunit [Betaproteobacteria bacterium]